MGMPSSHNRMVDWSENRQRRGEGRMERGREEGERKGGGRLVGLSSCRSIHEFTLIYSYMYIGHDILP